MGGEAKPEPRRKRHACLAILSVPKCRDIASPPRLLSERAPRNEMDKAQVLESCLHDPSSHAGGFTPAIALSLRHFPLFFFSDQDCPRSCRRFPGRLWVVRRFKRHTVGERRSTEGGYDAEAGLPSLPLEDAIWIDGTAQPPPTESQHPTISSIGR